MFKFTLSANGNELVFPIAPSSFQTKVGNKNKTLEMVTMGEANVIKTIGLREFSFKVLFPKNDDLLADKSLFQKPVYFLMKLRSLKACTKPIHFQIQRILPNGDISFPGDLYVSLEDYTVDENAGEEGDYWVTIKLKEYRMVEAVKTILTGKTNSNGQATATQEIQRTTKEIAKTYTVKSGDSLWKIAKKELNDGSRYKEIAELNKLSNPNKLTVGQVLKLPS